MADFKIIYDAKDIEERKKQLQRAADTLKLSGLAKTIQDKPAMDALNIDVGDSATRGSPNPGDCPTCGKPK